MIRQRVYQIACGYAKSQTSIKRFQFFRYKAKSWKREQLVVVKIEVTPLGTNVRYVVTNMPKSYGPGLLYKISYCGRGTIELMIIEKKTYIKLEFASKHPMRAEMETAFRYRPPA